MSSVLFRSAFLCEASWSSFGGAPRSQQLAGKPPPHPGACPPLLGSIADGAFGRSSCEIRSPPQPSSSQPSSQVGIRSYLHNSFKKRSSLPPHPTSSPPSPPSPCRSSCNPTEATMRHAADTLRVRLGSAVGVPFFAGSQQSTQQHPSGTLTTGTNRIPAQS